MAEVVGSAIFRRRGDTAPDTLTLTNADGTEADLSGYSFALTVNTQRDPDPDISYGDELVSITGQIAGNVVTFAWNTTDANQRPGVYYYDVEQTDPLSRVLTIRKNTYTFGQDISK